MHPLMDTDRANPLVDSGKAKENETIPLLGLLGGVTLETSLRDDDGWRWKRQNINSDGLLDEALDAL